MRITSFLNLAADAYGSVTYDDLSLSYEQLVLKRGAFEPVNPLILRSIIASALDDTAVTLPAHITPALDTGIVYPFHFQPNRADYYHNLAHAYLLWVCNPDKINFGVRTKEFDPERAFADLRKLEEEMREFAAQTPPKEFDSSDVQANEEGDKIPEDELDLADPFDFDELVLGEESSGGEDKIPIDQFLMRHSTDLLDATRELGGLSNHKFASLIGSAMVGDRIGIITRYAMPRVRINHLFGVHGSHKIVDMFNQREFDYFGVDARGIQLLTTLPKRKAFESGERNDIKISDQRVILPILVSMNTERTLGLAAFRQLALGVILPFSHREIDALSLKDEIDVTDMVLGPGFSRYDISRTDIHKRVGLGVEILRDRITANVIGKVIISTTYHTNIPNLSDRDGTLYGALVSLKLRKPIYVF